MFPVFILNLKGYLCSCLISEETLSVLQAMMDINGIRVTYYSPNQITKSSNSIKNMVSGLFRSTRKSDINSNNGTNKGMEGTLSVIDSNQGPSLCLQLDHHDASSSNFIDNDIASTSSSHNREIIQIPLHMIGDIKEASRPSRIVIYTRSGNTSEPTLLCSLDLMTQSQTHDDDISEHRESIIDSLNTIVQWNDVSQRLEGETDIMLQHDTQGGTQKSLSQHALKLKHFANREIELKKLKRDREERKQRYLKDSGGLKYTAIAMANREMT